MPVVALSPGANVAGRPPVLPSSSTTTVTVKAPFQSAGTAALGASGSCTAMVLMRLLIWASVPERVTDRPSPAITALPPVPAPTPVMVKPAGTDTVVVRMLLATASWSVTVMPVIVTLPLPSLVLRLPAAMVAGSLTDDGNSVW